MKHARGFTLIELMVALVVGLVVTFAAVSFVVSVAKANSEDIRITRLTQELRALSEIMARDIRRARYVSDSIGNIGQAALAPNVNDPMVINGSCISYLYDQAPEEGGALVNRSIYLSGGQVFLSNACDAGGTPISSPQVEITSLTFDNDRNAATAVTPPAPPAVSNVDFEVRSAIVGRLRNDPSLADVSRRFEQDIFIRSGKVD